MKGTSEEGTGRGMDGGREEASGGGIVRGREGNFKYPEDGTGQYSRTSLIRPPSESHWCGRIRGMVAREGFVYKQKALSVTRNVVV